MDTTNIIRPKGHAAARLLRPIVAALLLLVATTAVASARDKTIKILAIGNSFSREAIEQNLHELAEADGRKCVIGSLYIGGCSLEKHIGNIRADSGAYEYRKIGLDGTKKETLGMSISRALADEEWDYVSVQQVSGLSGFFSTYEASLPELMAYVRHRTPRKCRIVLHQTWAYAPNSSHEDFVRYDRSQIRMYLAIMDASFKAIETYKLTPIIPSGTAIQNARGTSLGADLTRDGYHLDLVVGRYIAACTWYEALFGENVMGNSFAPDGLSPKDKALAQWAAHQAVEKPFRITYHEEGAELEK